MNLIVVSSLSCDEGLYFRYITMIAKEELGYDILLEARKEDVDYYFELLKRKGWFDFVDDFVLPEWREEGVRIDKELNYSRTIQVDSIKCENTLNILGQLKGFEKWN
jgi:hypothetical protein|tara:strand:+ start:2890 stop:3210 length:321 start_codon:yes stop_codon:yes gene_type:complete